MSENRRVTNLMASQYAHLLAQLNQFGDLQVDPNITPGEFEAARRACIAKIRETRHLLAEAENQVRMLQLHPEQKEATHGKETPHVHPA